MAIEPANLGESQAFEQLAEPFCGEIKLHCYRMLGSLHEADDAVQETYLRAWRSFSSFEAGTSDERGSFRAWLYKIATNASLDALAARKYAQRLLPDQKTPASIDVRERGGPKPIDVAWLEPFPDSNLEGIVDYAPNPEARYSSREAVRLAFVAAIQLLPPRQRAALLLCDVIGWTASEAASLLGGSTSSINSALQRGRETLARHYPDGRPQVASRPDPALQNLHDRYLHAWEGFDVDGFVALLKDDASLTMPPWPRWYAGRENLRTFFGMVQLNFSGLRLVPTAANGQPAFGMYERTREDAPWAAHSIHVLTFQQGMITAITAFGAPALFHSFGLPLSLPNDAGSEIHVIQQPLEDQAEL